jgi:hypothetical protein
MKATFGSRLEKLEARRRAAEIIHRAGIVIQLADDYVGERHVVLVSQSPTEMPHLEWCSFEERRGLGPNEAEGAAVIYISEADTRL